MSVFLKMIQLYERQGFKIRIGLNPYHFKDGNAHFGYIYKKGEMLSTGAGISVQEIYFFECLFRNYTPKNIFGIGNAFGWSSVCLSLLNPYSTVVIIDAGVEGEDNLRGIKLTNRIAEEENLNLKVVKGFSPQDIPDIVKKNYEGEKIDFVFIDGLHTNEQQEDDFWGIEKFCLKSCIYVFHDVINWKMEQSFEKIAKISGLDAKILYRTPSGMGVLYPKNTLPEIKECIEAFSEDMKVVESLSKSLSASAKFKAKLVTLMPGRLINIAKKFKKFLVKGN